MMNGTNFAPPPGLKGDEKANLVQMHSFLFRLTEQLNAALAQTDNAIQKAQTAATAYSGKPVNEAMETEYRELKSLIVKSADIVRSEMDVITDTLKSDYVAQSEYGEFRESVTADITATAKGVEENYSFISSVNQFQKESQGYIKRGVIGYDDNSQPIYGIAIGEKIKATEVRDENGALLYETFDDDNNIALYTADRLSFHQNGVEVAYFSSSSLHTTRTAVSDVVSLGIQTAGYWEIDRKYGFSIRWIPGAAERSK